MNASTEQLRRWIPRILALILAAFLGLFSMDVFSEGYSPLEAAGAFLVHSIPSLLILVGLAIAWRHERAGGLLFLALGAVAVFRFRGLPAFVIVALPAFLVGILFLLASTASTPTPPFAGTRSPDQ